MPYDDLEELKDLTPEEREAVLSILKEYSKEGKSDTFENLKYEDYEEIPVDVETFLKDPRYLGKGLIGDDGRFTVFPFWVETMKKIFPNNIDTAYNTLILTGAIGIGKSFFGVLCELYQLHRLLCLKDPYVHYGLQPIDKITISLLNAVSVDAAKGVAWDKLQQLIQSSEWFLSHGTLKGRTNIEYVPDKRIEIIAGSRNSHVIGRAIFCLDGDTCIKTNKGYLKIKDLCDKENLQVVSLDNNKNETLSDICKVLPTIKTDEEYQIELEDGTIIKCTANHRFMLKDGSYKEAQYLTEDDELFNIL